MCDYVTVQETKDLVLETPLHKGNLHFPYDVLLHCSGESHLYSIQQRDFKDVPDCKIGNFYLNIYMRPDKACKKDFMGYKDVGSFSRAVRACINANGYTFMGWVKRIT